MSGLLLTDLMLDLPKVIQFMDDNFFTDSSITLAEEQYLKKNIMEFLFQVVCLNEGLIYVNTDVKDMEYAMYRSSISDKYIGAILDASLTVNKEVTVTAKGELEHKAGDSSAENEKILRNSLDSLENMIYTVGMSLGQKRVEYHINEETGEHILWLSKPLSIKTSSFNFDNLSSIEDIEHLIHNCLLADSGVRLDQFIPMSVLPDGFEAVRGASEAILQDLFTHARNHSMNKLSFVVREDPFKTLFDSL